jgi:RNA polymerase sigma-70 factor (ECF subfamily)
MLDEVFKAGLQNKAKSAAINSSDGSQMSDEHLVRAALDGDEHAFAELFERHKRLVAGVVGRFLRDRSAIEEAVQQSFAKIYFSLKDFRGGRDHSFPAWATRIAVNVCYDEFRRRSRRSESLFTELDDESGFLEMVPSDETTTAETKVISAQLAEKVLSQLDPRDRIAMTLVYSQDYSLNDAADIIGISAGNLKSRLFRCRNLIKTRFAHLFD